MHKYMHMCYFKMTAHIPFSVLIHQMLTGSLALEDAEMWTFSFSDAYSNLRQKH